MQVEPLILPGRQVSLVPLLETHHDGLVEATRDGELWTLWSTIVPSPEGMAAEIQRRLDLQEQGRMLPFTIVEERTGRVAGMTTYMNIDRANRRLEIGSTWLRRSAWRSAINTECKRLLLGHAFERLGCVAVELRTHRLNHRSRAAIERIGAQLDGILRAHMVMPDGTLRDTCVYSIIAPEWPAVRAFLDHELGRPRAVRIGPAVSG